MTKVIKEAMKAPFHKDKDESSKTTDAQLSAEANEMLSQVKSFDIRPNQDTARDSIDEV
jgi:hypothetical protein